MTDRTQKGGLQVASILIDLVADKIAPGTGVEPDSFWQAFEEVLNDLAPKNRVLLQKRDDLQAKIDAWHIERKGQDHDAAAYKQFLLDIGYLVPEGDDFEISTSKVDPEIATIAGAQLVVPTSNARFALNAANARWGSLYDALYGTDVIDEEGGKERTQVFQGSVIGRRGRGLNAMITVRRISYGEGVEKIFPVNSPNVGEVEVLRRGKVRRAKLNYLRGRIGKRAMTVKEAR